MNVLRRRSLQSIDKFKSLHYSYDGETIIHRDDFRKYFCNKPCRTFSSAQNIFFVTTPNDNVNSSLNNYTCSHGNVTSFYKTYSTQSDIFKSATQNDQKSFEEDSRDDRSDKNHSQNFLSLKNVFGFCTGIIFGAFFKITYDSGVFSLFEEEDDEENDMYTSQLLDVFIPPVFASKGFNDAPTEESQSENNGNSKFLSPKHGMTGSGGKEPPKHRANFNFIADVVERLAPSVVFIEILDLRRRGGDGKPMPINNGSGFVVDSNGLILTNAHVVTNRPRASRVMVRLLDGRELEGKLEEVDSISDLALIRVNAKDLPVAPLGKSSSLRPGEFVVAVGSPLSLSNTVTAGVVSSTTRCASDLGLRNNDISYIQTDAAITFGNSGGPLADLDGDVIGINSMKATPGISFAIPIDAAKLFMDRAAAKRTQNKLNSSVSDSPKRRRYLGITMLSLTQDIISELQGRVASPLPTELTHGVLVWRVVVGSPAYHAGLQPGDVVTEINGHSTRSAKDVYRLLEKLTDLTMVVHRGNNRYTVTVTPEE